jgi:RNA polymerase sigma factor (sigma-70 family)
VRNFFKTTQNQKVTSLEVALDQCVLTGDERSKEFIYKKYYGYVLAVAIRYVKNHDDAEELTNESFVKAFSAIHKFSKKGEGAVLDRLFGGWLSRICANACIDFLRVKKHMLALDDEEGPYIPHPSVEGHHDLAVQDILDMLDQLPPIQKSIFNLYEVEGYSHEEIGEMLEIPESTSRTYLTRAKQKLRKIYANSEVRMAQTTQF